MNAFPRIRSAVFATLVAATLAGCGMEGGNDAAQAAHDREKSKAEWKLVVEWAGSEHEMPVERMDIYVNDDDDDDEPYNEIYEMVGDQMTLVGEFPAGLEVGYGEEFGKLIGRTVTISPSGGDPREPRSSFVTLSGTRVPVLGGTFTVEKTGGKWSGHDGNKTLWGTIELRIPSADGETTIRGRFASHAVTWG